jgi:hypothetical protein
VRVAESIGNLIERFYGDLWNNWDAGRLGGLP